MHEPFRAHRVDRNEGRNQASVVSVRRVVAGLTAVITIGLVLGAARAAPMRVDDAAGAAGAVDAARAPTAPSGAASAPKTSGSYVRRVETAGGGAVLEIASRRFTKAGVPTAISLVGVVHIGLPDYYQSIQQHLDEHALVLYESVTPRGAVHDAVSIESDPVRATRDSMLFLRRVMLSVRELDPAALKGAAQATDTTAAADAPTPSLVEQTLAHAVKVDSRFAPWVQQAASDAWGRAIEFEANDDGSFLLVSRGADGVPGGEGIDADIRLRTPKDRRATASADEALQPMLASLLGLAFQLQAVNYDRSAWVVSDMGERQLAEEFEARGIDAGPFMRALSGASLTAGLAGASVSLIRIADGLSGGKVRAFVKLMMIETLAVADERMLAQGMSAGFVEVILHRRNDVVYDALREQLDAKELPATIAVFYGAAHMPDLEARLLEEGWKPADEKWFPAMSIDPVAAGLDPKTVAQMRVMLREMLQEMKKATEQP